MGIENLHNQNRREGPPNCLKCNRCYAEHDPTIFMYTGTWKACNKFPAQTYSVSPPGATTSTAAPGLEYPVNIPCLSVAPTTIVYRLLRLPKLIVGRVTENVSHYYIVWCQNGVYLHIDICSKKLFVSSGNYWEFLQECRNISKTRLQLHLALSFLNLPIMVPRPFLPVNTASL